MGGGLGIKVALMLIALGFGYIVCYLANREEKDLRRIGQVIGVIIISISLFLIVHELVMFILIFKQQAHFFIK